MHETIWNPKAARKAAPARHRAAGRKAYLVGGSKESWLFSKLSLSLARDVPKRWRWSHEIQVGARSSAQTNVQSETGLNQDFIERCSCLRLSHRSMDHQTCCRGDRKALRRGVSLQPSLAISDSSGMELPKARKASQGARRSSHTALEALRVAPYKKTRIGLAPTWSFLMKVAFCWFPALSAHGHREVRHHTFRWWGTGRKSRPFLLLPFLPRESALLFMRGSTPVKTSVLQKLRDFFAIFSGTSEVISSSCGTVALFTVPVLLKGSSNVILGLKRFSFQGMPLNSTRMNLCGLSLKEPLLTLFLRTWFILKEFSCRHCAGCAIHSVYCGHAYEHLIYHGSKLSITYA